MQLYVDRNRPKAEALIHKINNLGLKAIFVTVDCPAPGKREADERSVAEIEASQMGDMPGELNLSLSLHDAVSSNPLMKHSGHDGQGQGQERRWYCTSQRRIHRPNLELETTLHG